MYLDSNVYSYIKEKGFYLPDYQDDVVVDNMSDEEFLKKYDSSSYEKVSITTDITLFSVSDLGKDNYRQIDQKAFSILLVKRNTHPFLGMWCLPGGFLSLDETLIDCAKRVLFSEANLNNIYLDMYDFKDQYDIHKYVNIYGNTRRLTNYQEGKKLLVLDMRQFMFVFSYSHIYNVFMYLNEWDLENTITENQNLETEIRTSRSLW